MFLLYCSAPVVPCAETDDLASRDGARTEYTGILFFEVGAWKDL